MTGLTDTERERAERGTIPEVIGHICSADGCDQNAARRQFRKALTDGVIGHLRWEDSRPVDAATVSPDIPPSRHPHWVDAEINWEAGTVRDDWGEGPPRHRVMLIRWAPVRKYWPEMEPPADWDDPERYEAQGARLLRKEREEREAYDAAWDAAWHAECAKEVSQRQYFTFGELADALARDPVTLIVDESLRDRILSDLESWHRNQQFADGEVAWLGGNPPTFVPVSPHSPGAFFACLEWTMVQRAAASRYVAANPLLPGAPRLLTWLFGASAESEPRPPIKDESLAADQLLARSALPIPTTTQVPEESSEAEDASRLVTAVGSSSQPIAERIEVDQRRFGPHSQKNQMREKLEAMITGGEKFKTKKKAWRAVLRELDIIPETTRGWSYRTFVDHTSDLLGAVPK